VTTHTRRTFLQTAGTFGVLASLGVFGRGCQRLEESALDAAFESAANIFHRVKDFVFASDVVAQTYACACLQNLCKDVEFAKLVKTFELIPELERIVRGAKAVP
jgi:hypothetical protein